MAAKPSGIIGVIQTFLDAHLENSSGRDFMFRNKFELSRKYESIFAKLEVSESEKIFEITGCRKPCQYKKYIFLGDPYPSAFKSDDHIFSLWVVSDKTRVETEELIYPSSSLVADM